MTTANNRLELGKAKFEELTGHPAEAFIDSLKNISPDFARRALEWEFGDVMAQTALDRRLQEAVAVAVFATLGATAAQVLKLRIGTALRAGLSKDEVVDILNQVALGAGLPAGLAALQVAEAAFAGSDEPLGNEQPPSE
ncbi:carboxymuconolactone decarboxylase family protein [Rhizobium glycinendophyticum]|uniref:Carboxymuconolactone decarboxylase family protein n=1 Tax=Rhizobium glycinendophyticum TaxID=2589807 RepID=A0A504TUF2_9HYPH|nr:carboxymuconolactone decarboxylase family protein [Rhizobium glycinendophyticum]TPP05030.1 carboxymuconolactone decarboxylase family protein [Rhizobium glycinendophyticum]